MLCIGGFSFSVLSSNMEQIKVDLFDYFFIQVSCMNRLPSWVSELCIEGYKRLSNLGPRLNALLNKPWVFSLQLEEPASLTLYKEPLSYYDVRWVSILHPLNKRTHKDTQTSASVHTVVHTNTHSQTDKRTYTKTHRLEIGHWQRDTKTHTHNSRETIHRGRRRSASFIMKYVLVW